MPRLSEISCSLQIKISDLFSIMDRTKINDEFWNDHIKSISINGNVLNLKEAFWGFSRKTETLCTAHYTDGNNVDYELDTLINMTVKDVIKFALINLSLVAEITL